MTIRLYADEFRVAIYEEAPGGGDPLDPTSLMNRPIMSPTSWLANVYFHSDFDYYSTAINASVTINHAAVPAFVTNVTPIFDFYGQIVSTSHLLAAHSFGIIPRFFVIYAGKMIPHGTPIQDAGTGLKRFVTAYATTTQIRLFDLGYSSNVDLPAISLNYGCLVFGPSAADPLLSKLMIEPGNVIFGQGKFRMEWPHLRIVATGESPYKQAMSRTAAISNGTLRVWSPGDASPIDFPGTATYNGTLTAAPIAVDLQAGV